MSENSNKNSVVHVSAHDRGNSSVRAHTRSAPGSGGSGGGTGEGLSVTESVSPSYATEADTLVVKQALTDSGYYTPDPKMGITPWPDAAMFEGIKSFQKDAGIYPDGVIKPGGETEKAINSKLNGKSLEHNFIPSDSFRELLHKKESLGSGGYTAHNKANPDDFGAVGKYQFRRRALVDAGYLNKDYTWNGKDGIHSVEDFKNSPDVQARALDAYFKGNHRALIRVKAYDKLGETIKGRLGSSFKITQAGLLAASHKEGPGEVRDYLNSLDRDSNGNYYMNYNRLDKETDAMFRTIETRIREFEDC